MASGRVVGGPAASAPAARRHWRSPWPSSVFPPARAGITPLPSRAPLTTTPVWPRPQVRPARAGGRSCADRPEPASVEVPESPPSTCRRVLQPAEPVLFQYQSHCCSLGQPGQCLTRGQRVWDVLLAVGACAKRRSWSASAGGAQLVGVVRGAPARFIGASLQQWEVPRKASRSGRRGAEFLFSEGDVRPDARFSGEVPDQRRRSTILSGIC